MISRPTRARSACRLLARVAALSLLAGTSALAADVTYVLTARGDLRERSPLPGERLLPTGEVELLPVGEATIVGTVGQIAVRYNPTLFLREPQGGLAAATFLNRGRLGLLKRWDRASFGVAEDAAYGVIQVSPLLPLEGELAGAVPVTQSAVAVPFERTATMAALDVNPTDRVSFFIQGGYVLQGSPEEPGQYAGMPLQQGPTGTARFQWVASRRDRLITSVQVNEMSQLRFAVSKCLPLFPNADPPRPITDCAPAFPRVEEELTALATEGWSRQLSRSINGTVTAGAAAVKQRLVVADPSNLISPSVNRVARFEVVPVAVASLAFRHAHAPLTATAALQLAPYTDRFTGQVYERVEARGSGEWRPSRDLTLFGTAVAAWATPIGLEAQAGDLLVAFEATATWWMTPWFGAALGLRGAFVDQPASPPAVVQFAATVSMLVRDQGSTAW